MNNVTFEQFNTGRQYTESGQVIQCRVTQYREFCDILEEYEYTYKVVFYDVSRGIFGKLEYFGLDDKEFNELDFMEQYDKGRYTDIGFSDKQLKELINHFKR